MRTTALALVRAAHAGPALAVTVLAGLLGVAADLSPPQVALVTSAVLAGQLSVGWSNDLRDVARNSAVGRRDKPLASGDVAESTVRTACALAVAATVVLSLLCGLVAGAVHLLCITWPGPTTCGSRARSRRGCRMPCPSVDCRSSSGSRAARPLRSRWSSVGRCSEWLPMLNVVPDLAQDAATGIRGLPHRLGARASVALAVALLVAVTVLLLAVGSARDIRTASSSSLWARPWQGWQCSPWSEPAGSPSTPLSASRSRTW